MPEAHWATPPTPCPRRVAIVGTLPPLRAISSYCEGLAVAQARYSEVEFYSFRALYPGFLYPGGALEDPAARAPQAVGLRIHRTLSWYNPLSWLAVGLRCRGHVLNLQWWSLPLAPVLLLIGGVARLRGIPVVTTVHNVEPHGGGSRLFRVASRLLYRLSDRLIVHSQANARHLRTLHPRVADRVRVSRMGFADFAQGRPVDRQRARRRLGLPPARPVLLMFGALRDYKGLPDALRAMAAVARSHKDALLLVAGQAWGDEAQYRGIVKALALDAQVRLDLRYIPEPEIHDYFSAADLLLLPYTGFSAQSGAGISALAYGLPILASRCGSLPELVADEASLIAPGDHAALARRIVALLDDPALLAALRDDSRTLAREHSWDAICARLCAEYQALATHRSQE